MGKIFKVDGTNEWFDEVYDEQEQLKNTISSFESNISSWYDDLRSYRNNELLASDWTQGADSPFASDKKALWQSYRTKMRDLPNHAKAPIWFEESDIPLAPGQSSVPDDALQFLKSNADPLGIGTSSWVGVGTDGVYFKQTRPCAQITFDSSSKVGGISTDKAVIGTHDTINFELNITDLASISLYDYKIKSQPETLFVDQTGVVTVVPDSNFVGIATVPISISGAAGTVTSPITIGFSYIVDGQEYETFVGVVTT
tara:strand:- start:255 stop:1022 length:768 start_codon:yes stop_codon:yes gene_type:complete